MNKVWNFLESRSVYIYPSANADDEGKSNSEKNVANITDKLICKGFVVRKDKNQNPPPLHVELCPGSSTKIRVTNGAAVLEGYYINLSKQDSDYIIDDSLVQGLDYSITADHFEDLEGYFNKFKEAYDILYDVNGNAKNVSKKVKEETKLPMIHLVFKLLKNATGNIRGDLLEAPYGGAPRTQITCKGTAWSFATDEELESLGIPYLDLALIQLDRYKTDLSKGKVIINQIINPDSKYAYIDEDSVVTEDGIPIKQWVENYVYNELRHLDTIYCVECNEDKEGHEDNADIVQMTLSVKDQIPRVVRYNIKNPKSYNEDGTRQVVAIPIPEEQSKPSDNFDSGEVDQSYSLDEIAKRTHLASRMSADSQIDQYYNKVATHYFSGENHGDTGDGYTWSYNKSESGNIRTKNENGVSPLSARSDHTHDSRYIRSSSALGESGAQQTIATPLEFLKTLVVNGLTTLKNGLSVIGNAEISGTGLFGSNLSVKGALLSGYSKSKNDYLFKTNTSGGFLSKLIVANDTYTKIIRDTTISDTTPTLEVGAGTGTGVLAIKTTGDIRGGRVFGAVWNDYAELYLRDNDRVIEPGTIISKVKGKDTYDISDKDSQYLVVGICSDTYGHLLGGEEELSIEENLKKYIPVALAGRTLVKVVAGIRIVEGDLIVVSDDPGRGVPSRLVDIENYGRYGYDGCRGRIVGKALESSDGTKDKILVQVFLG